MNPCNEKFPESLSVHSVLRSVRLLDAINLGLNMDTLTLTFEEPIIESARWRFMVRGAAFAGMTSTRNSYGFIIGTLGA